MKNALSVLFIPAFLFAISGCKNPYVNGSDDIKRPNILWITCEDMSPRLGSYGDTLVSTPNLDRLAGEGIRFTNAYSVTGVCSPNRASLITGLYPTSFGAYHMRTTSRTAVIDQITDPELLSIPVYEAVPPAEAKIYPELFRMAGKWRNWEQTLEAVQ